MGYINGVNLLPSTGEFTYDTIAYLGQRVTESTLSSINRYANGGPAAGTGSTTDYTISINNLQAEYPGCTTVSLVVAWFGNPPISPRAKSILRRRISTEVPAGVRRL